MTAKRHWQITPSHTQQKYTRCPQFLDRFYLPVNFAVTDSGIEFTYEQYEVGPRPLGMPAFTIPHGEIKTLADKSCTLQRYFYQ